MNIGKWSFDQILKISLEKTKVTYAFKGTLLAMAISWLITLAIKTMENFAVDLRVLGALDIVGSMLAGLVFLFTVIGLNLQLKNDQGKTKKKLPLKEVLSFGWKTIGSILIYLFFAIVFGIAFFLATLLAKISFIGPYLMALLGIPLVIAAACFVLYLFITGKLILPSIAENQKKNSWEIVKDVVTLTKENWKKVVFNFVLALLPIFTLISALMLVIGGAYLVYLGCCWVMPGLAVVLKFSLNMPASVIGILLALSGLFIAAYALAHILVMSTTLLYSIYLDAKK